MSTIITTPQEPATPDGDQSASAGPSGPPHSAGKAAFGELPTLNVPERLGYRMKRALLGKPLVTAALSEEKLSKTSALGVLSSDCISSSAYGTEEMLIVLLGAFGLAGFHILLPTTVAVLAVLFFMTLSYREVVMVYTQAGGSYVVARENFGPRIAQIASVALLIDYVVTVAVQASAGIAAITSMVPALNSERTATTLTVIVVVILAFGNLRGIREAAKAFAAPTYLFVASAGLVVVVGLIRVLFGNLPVLQHVVVGKGAKDYYSMIPIIDSHNQILSAAAVFLLLRAFANGGSSMTGLEAISNGVSVFKNPRSQNARRTLSTMSLLLGFLVAGISFLAFKTHATPYNGGSPTVISQIALDVFGHGWIGHAGYYIVQIVTALVLITGANTPFTGFPFLASFVAEDSFLPRQLTRRGHRLAFSNGILTLTGASLALILVVGSNVNSLVPFYAIGVFTGFSMAGYGMAKYHTVHRETGWRKKFAINMTGGILSTIVVLVFAITKFTEGAWLVVVLFPVAWFILLRLNKKYRAEAQSLELVSNLDPTARAARYPRHVVLLMVDRLDLAVLRARRYAGSLHPSDIIAVHVNIDNLQAQALERDWIARNLGDDTPLRIVECQDRRLVRSVAEQALTVVVQEHAEVTVLLPRRTFGRLSQRLLHDRTADRIAEAMGRIPHVSATIVPFDTTLPPEAAVRLEEQRKNAARQPALSQIVLEKSASADKTLLDGLPSAANRPGITAIGTANHKDQVTIEGRIRSVMVGTTAGKSLEADVFDDTGGIRILFFGRTGIAGIECGTVIRATGRIGEFKGHLALANPVYEIVPASALAGHRAG